MTSSLRIFEKNLDYAIYLKEYFHETMNEERIQQLLQAKINSMNDYTDDEIYNISQIYYKQNKKLISKHISFFTRNFKLGNNCISFVLDGYQGKDYNSDEFIECRFKFSRQKLLVPIEFVALMEALLLKDCKDIGLFRKPSSVIDARECRKVFTESLEKGDTLDEIVQKLIKYDPIVLSGNFKQLFQSFSTTIFPQKFFKSILKITFIDNEHDKFILSKYILLQMPKENRNIFEAIIKFFEIIHDITTNGGIEYVGNLDLKGYGTVIMPNLFLNNEKNITFRDLTSLAEYAGYLIINFRDLLDVTEIAQNSS